MINSNAEHLVLDEELIEGETTLIYQVSSNIQQRGDSRNDTNYIKQRSEEVANFEDTPGLEIQTLEFDDGETTEYTWRYQTESGELEEWRFEFGRFHKFWKVLEYPDRVKSRVKQNGATGESFQELWILVKESHGSSLKKRLRRCNTCCDSQYHWEQGTFSYYLFYSIGSIVFCVAGLMIYTETNESAMARWWGVAVFFAGFFIMYLISPQIKNWSVMVVEGWRLNDLDNEISELLDSIDKHGVTVSMVRDEKNRNKAAIEGLQKPIDDLKIKLADLEKRRLNNTLTSERLNQDKTDLQESALLMKQIFAEYNACVESASEIRGIFAQADQVLQTYDTNVENTAEMHFLRAKKDFIPSTKGVISEDAYNLWKDHIPFRFLEVVPEYETLIHDCGELDLTKFEQYFETWRERGVKLRRPDFSVNIPERRIFDSAINGGANLPVEAVL